jgi:hypothetical protein
MFFQHFQQMNRRQPSARAQNFNHLRKKAFGMRLALYRGMEECTKVAVQYGVHIEVVCIAVWNPQAPSSWTPFEPAVLMRSLGPVELGHHSTIPHLGCSGKPRAPLTGKASLHGRARGRPRYTSPFPPHRRGCRGRLTRKASQRLSVSSSAARANFRK